MSEDDIDSLLVEVIKQFEDELGDPDFFNDDDMFDRMKEIFYFHLEPFCTKERNYN